MNRLYTILQIHICDSSSPLPNNDQQDQGYYFDRNGALVGLARALGHLLLLSNVEITRWAKSPIECNPLHRKQQQPGANQREHPEFLKLPFTFYCQLSLNVI